MEERGREGLRAHPGYTGCLDAGFYIISLERGGSCNPYTRRLPAGGPTKEEAQNWGAANTAQFFDASQRRGLTHQQLGGLGRAGVAACVPYAWHTSEQQHRGGGHRCDTRALGAATGARR